MRVAILKNDLENSVDGWIKACDKLCLTFDVIDLTREDWLGEVIKHDYDFYLAKPPSAIEKFKILYDERLYIITKILKKVVYPSYEECIIYENKKLFSYYLRANKIPHPATYVFYYYQEALEYLNLCKFPIVAKTSVGAGGTGIKIVRSFREGKAYCRSAFLMSGIRKQLGPNPVTGSPKSWLQKTLRDPKYFIKRCKFYIDRYRNCQFGYVIFQEYVEHDFEWRVVKVGDSFFAIKKYKYKDKASGAKKLAYENPPPRLLNFVRFIATQLQIQAAAFDIFEREDAYLINEIQTIFGQSLSHLLEVNGVPGRYKFDEDEWVFAAGTFNTNQSYDLKLKFYINQFSKQKGVRNEDFDRCP